jgi:hypothetical protein
MAPYGDFAMDNFQPLNPIDDLETVMAMTVAIVREHIPDYRGKISLVFSDLPFPDDPRASFRGNAVLDPPIGPRIAAVFDRFITGSAMGLEIDKALREGWLDYEGDLVLTLHRMPADEPFVIERENGTRIVIEFGR